MYLPTEIKNLKFDIYIRRSSDDTDHQIASIDQQRDYLANFIKKEGIKEGIEVNKMLEESRSAKQPGRPVFGELMARIESGESQGIVCWDLTRLSRNPVDSGRLSWLLQNGILKAIITPQKIYLPEDNVLLMNVEFGMANQYLRDLSRNVKRGLYNKVNTGWRPCVAPEGYLNDLSEGKGKSKIAKDPERFDLIRKMWDLLLIGTYSVPQILEIANGWGFRTRSHKKLSNTKLSRSGLYRLFTNPFYYGQYQFGGQWFTGKHEPMITQAEFDHAQAILGRKGKQRPKTREFAYTGMIRCGQCGASITAEEKVNRYGSRYIYYHCTKKINPNCTQRTIQLKDVEKQIDDLLARLEISEAFKDWSIQYLNELHDRESFDQIAIDSTLDRSYTNCVQQIQNLIKLKISPQNMDGTLLSEGDYQMQMVSLQKEKADLEQQRRSLGERVDQWVQLSEKTFQFACYARTWLRNGTLQDKRQILQTLGSNFLLQDGKLSLDLPKPLVLASEAKIEVDNVTAKLEPEELTVLTPQLAHLFAEDPTLRSLYLKIRTSFIL